MDVDRFARLLPSLWDGDPQTADHPIDRRFREIVETTGGMATENKLAVLNLATAHLGAGEVYLEVGTFVGTSAIGAALGNSTRRVITVDNFSEFGGPEETCRANLASFDAGNVELVVDDAFRYLRTGRLTQPIGVYFYDGGHRFHEHLAALRNVEPYLAGRALVIVDDASQRRVRVANQDVTRRDPALRPLIEFTSAVNGEPRWWNGLAIFDFDRTRRPAGWQTRTDARDRYHQVRYGPVSDAAAWVLTRRRARV